MSRSYVKFKLFSSLGLIVSRPGFLLAGRNAVCAMIERVGIWSLLEGKIVNQILPQSTTLVTTMTKSPDDSRLAIGYSNGTVRVFALDPFDEVISFHASRKAITSLTFREDGEVLIAGSGTTVTAWDIGAGRGIFVVEGLAAPSIHLAYLDPTTIIVGSTDGTVSVICTSNQAIMAAVPAHSSVVRGIGFWDIGETVKNDETDNEARAKYANAGKWIISAGDKEVRAWRLSPDKTTLTCVGSMNPPCGDIYGLDTKKQFLAVFGKKHIVVYTLRSLKEMSKKERKKKNKRLRKAALADSEDDEIIPNGQGSGGQSKDPTAGAEFRETLEEGEKDEVDMTDFFVQRAIIRVPEQPINIVIVPEVADDGRMQLPHSILVSTIGNRLIIYKPVSRDTTSSAITAMEVNRMVSHNGHRGQIRALWAAGNEGSLVLFTAGDDSVKVWGVNSKTEQAGAPVPICTITNAELLEYGTTDGAQSSMSGARGNIPQGFNGVSGICALKGNRFVICGTRGGDLIILDVGTASVAGVAHSDSGISVMTCSKDASLIVTGHEDGTLTVWTPVLVTKQGQTVSLGLELVKLWSIKCSDGICALALSPDAVCVGRDLKVDNVAPTRGVVFAALLDCTVRSFSLATQKNIHCMYGHALPVFGIDVSIGDVGESDSSIIATVSGDRTVRVWGGVFGECIRTIRLGALAHSASTASTSGLSGSTQTTSTSTSSVPGRPCISIIPNTHHAVVGLGDALTFVDCDSGKRIYDLYRCQGKYSLKAGAFTSVRAAQAGGVGARTSVAVCSGSTDGSIRIFSQYVNPDEPDGELVFEGDYERDIEEDELDMEVDQDAGAKGWEEGMKPVGLGGKGDVRAIDRLEEALDAVETGGVDGEGSVLTMQLPPDEFIIHVLRDWIVPTAIPYCLRMLTFPRALLLLMLLTRRIRRSGAKGIEVEFCITHALDVVRIHRQTLVATAKDTLLDFYNAVDADVLESRRKLVATNYGALEILRRRIDVHNGEDS